MIGVYRELEGTMRLAAHVLRRFWVLKLPPVAEELARQIYFTGASATATAMGTLSQWPSPAGRRPPSSATGSMAQVLGFR